MSMPETKPRLSSTQLRERIKSFNVDRQKYPVVVVGIRGYYKNTLGKPGENDRNIYDDAIFIESIHSMTAFNANTDPSAVRKGKGTGGQKGMARLKPGAYYVHKFDKHNGKYLALCQRAGNVTVIRDGISGDYEDTGANFGINIHKGSINTTSSEGCQTIPPSQWKEFIDLAVGQAKRFFGDKWTEQVIPYILLEE